MPDHRDPHVASEREAPVAAAWRFNDRLRRLHGESVASEHAEIERLRAALREIVAYPVGDDGYIDIAKAALDA